MQSFSGHRTAFTDLAGIDCENPGNQYSRFNDFLKENNYSFKDILTINFNKPKISSKNLNQILIKNLKNSGDEIFIRMRKTNEDKIFTRNEIIKQQLKPLKKLDSKKAKKRVKKSKYYYFEDGERRNLILNKKTNLFKSLSSDSNISAKTLCRDLKENNNSMSPYLERDCYIKYR